MLMAQADLTGSAEQLGSLEKPTPSHVRRQKSGQKSAENSFRDRGEKHDPNRTS